MIVGILEDNDDTNVATTHVKSNIAHVICGTFEVKNVRNDKSSVIHLKEFNSIRGKQTVKAFCKDGDNGLA